MRLLVVVDSCFELVGLVEADLVLGVDGLVVVRVLKVVLSVLVSVLEVFNDSFFYQERSHPELNSDNDGESPCIPVGNQVSQRLPIEALCLGA